MRRLWIVMAMLIFAGSVFADEKSTALLDKLSKSIGAHKNYQVDFVISEQEIVPELEGSYIVSGDKYYIVVEQREVYCDGKVKYEVNDDDMEVVVDNVNPKDRNILTNPTRAFEFLDGQYVHSSSGTATFGGKSCDVVNIKPVSADSGVGEIVLFLDKTSGLPIGVRYKIDSVEEPIEISIKAFNWKQSTAQSTFEFNKSKYKDFEIIDFR